IFHSVAISLARRANFVKKSQVEIRLGFFLGSGRRIQNPGLRVWNADFRLHLGANEYVAPI
ncbi:MAG: hypothetical protein ACOCOU_09950, partial [Prevotella sp.]